MIKLSEESRDIIAFAVKYCKLVDINALLIDKKGIRAKQDEKAVYLIESGDFSFLEFDAMYTNRVGSLYPRIQMFETSKIPYDIYADLKTLDDGTDIVMKLKVKGKNTSVNFNTNIIVPKGLPTNFKDPMYYSFEIQSDDLGILKKGISAMGAEEFKVFSTDNGAVSCEITDIERDVLTQHLADTFKVLHEDAPEEFATKYNFKILFPLLNEAGKEKEKIRVRISRKGIMLLKINGLSMYIFSETD